MNHSAFDRIFAALATVSVTAGTVAGFWILGTPGRQRLIMGDRQRLEDMSAIANSLYWKRQNQADYLLPDILEPEDQREDPITQELYQYRKIDDNQYQLCANFATDSSTYRLTNTSPQTWHHPQGFYCFEFDFNQQPPSLY